jgi:methionine sulfoxide reductase catalytic subunit
MSKARSNRMFESLGVKPSQITPADSFFNRREILAAALAAGVIGATYRSKALADTATPAPADGALKYTRNTKYSVDAKPNTFEDITSYNNFYELGTDKGDPKAHAGSLKPRPWKVEIDGEAEVKGTFDVDELIKPYPLEERIYRFRCVEAWSMVIPWQGIPLAEMIKRFEPQPSAKFVAFTTVMRPNEMPGQRRPVLQWPYVEGLRMDEATNDLTLMATGLYGKPLPNQDGAPIRLIVPWKYGFKGIKSIVKIAFVDRQPETTWNIAAPDEYGFYANVNPEVDHPRWSQATERRIGEFRRRRTLMFNGYADKVASMYSGMDLRRNY